MGNNIVIEVLCIIHSISGSLLINIYFSKNFTIFLKRKYE